MDAPNEESSLFVYGSLLDPLRRREIIGREVETVPASLDGFELRRARYFYIRKRPGSSTTGLVLLKLSRQDFDRLDYYEEIPRLYRREKIEVIDETGLRRRCWVYLPTFFLLTGN